MLNLNPFGTLWFGDFKIGYKINAYKCFFFCADGYQGSVFYICFQTETSP